MNRTTVPMLLLTAFGLGRIPRAPGTFGSLPPVALVVAISWIATSNHAESATLHWIVNAALVALLAIFGLACIAFGAEAESHFKRKDPPAVVADEVAGQSIALLFLPWRAGIGPGNFQWNLMVAACAFIAFRGFDIFKPPPARSLQRLPAGWGILIDDVIAGGYALIVAQVFSRFVLARFLG